MTWEKNVGTLEEGSSHTCKLPRMAIHMYSGKNISPCLKMVMKSVAFLILERLSTK